VNAPTLTASPDSPLSIAGDVLVIGVRQTPDGPRLTDDAPELASLQESLAAIGISGAADELRRLPATAGACASIALIGLGKGDPDANALRTAAGSATRQLRGVGTVVFDMPAADSATAAAVLEGAGIGAYAFTSYRSDPDATAAPASSAIVGGASVDDADLSRARAVVDAMHLVRDLVNTPPADLYPETLAARAVAEVDHLAAAGIPITVEVLDEIALAEHGYGGLTGVGRGSVRPPRLVVVRYAPDGAAKHLSLVGKGITFDTGGLSLKPPASMAGMKYDMTGAATVLGVVLAAARLGVGTIVTARLCIAENMPSGSATRPNDVLTMRGGRTVEVLNTDAEGRLVLADGLVDASAEHPDAIVDVATLTGAARVALGSRIVGAMGDRALTERVIEIAGTVGEQFWPMPIGEEFRPMLTSEVADIANVKIGNTAGGMLIAAAFLQEFVGRVGEGDDAPRIPWTHLDIAGPAHNDGAGYGSTAKGPTGTTVRALIALAESMAYDGPNSTDGPDAVDGVS
jgi:leucyl aminopeptidase